MHIIDGNFLETSCNQCLMFHIQNLIKKHHQNVIKELLLLHVLTSMYADTAQTLYCPWAYYTTGIFCSQ